MAKETTTNNVPLTEADIEQWGREAEAGFPGWEFGKPVAGRPISVGREAKPFTLRLDADRRTKLDEIAHSRHITPSQLMRDLIDTL